MKKKTNHSSTQPLAALLVPQVLDSRSMHSLREWDALAKQKAQCFCKPEPLEMGLFFAQSGVRKLKKTGAIRAEKQQSCTILYHLVHSCTILCKSENFISYLCNRF